MYDHKFKHNKHINEEWIAFKISNVMRKTYVRVCNAKTEIKKQGQ